MAEFRKFDSGIFHTSTIIVCENEAFYLSYTGLGPDDLFGEITLAEAEKFKDVNLPLITCKAVNSSAQSNLNASAITFQNSNAIATLNASQLVIQPSLELDSATFQLYDWNKEEDPDFEIYGSNYNIFIQPFTDVNIEYTFNNITTIKHIQTKDWYWNSENQLSFLIRNV